MRSGYVTSRTVFLSRNWAQRRLVFGGEFIDVSVWLFLLLYLLNEAVSRISRTVSQFSVDGSCYFNLQSKRFSRKITRWRNAVYLSSSRRNNSKPTTVISSRNIMIKIAIFDISILSVESKTRVLPEKRLQQWIPYPGYKYFIVLRVVDYLFVKKNNSHICG